MGGDGGAQANRYSRRLHDPATNLAIGQSYVMYLATMDGVNGDLIRLLGSYNAGPTSFTRMQATMPDSTDPLLFIESIPNEETRGFVPRALAYSWIYAARLHLPSPSLDAMSAGEWPTFPGPAAKAGRGRALALKEPVLPIDPTRTFVPVSIAVLTVSDTRTAANDVSGDVLAARVEAAGHRLADRAIERDEVGGIERRLRRWIAEPEIDVVITTGGTGITGRDVTPEAFDRVLEKRIEGFGELFRMISFGKIGTSTIQSRAIAGVVQGTYLFALPGSTGAVKDGWDEILVWQLGQPPRAVQPGRTHAAAAGAS